MVKQQDNGRQVPDMPEGWALAELPEIADIIMGQSPPGKSYNDSGDGLPFFQGKADFGLLYPTVRKWCTQPTKLAHWGDILLSVRAPVGPTNIAKYECAIGRGLAAIRPYPGIETGLLLYGLRLQESELASKGTGSTFTAISRRHIDAIELLVPPCEEQKRIVAKLDEVLGRIQNVRERLEKVPAILKRFRQAVLADACSGQLTAEWREGKSLELAEQRLIRLRAARPTKAELAAGFPVKRWRIEDSREPDLAGLPSIPDTWAWVCLPELGYMNRGRSRNRPRNAPHLYGGEYPFIQTGDIARSGGRVIDHRQTYSEAGLEQSRLWPAGTICITIAANIADSAILDYPACFPDSVVGLITDPELCVAEFAEFFIRTAREDLSQFAPATAQKNINIGILNEVAVPLPPLEEQREIVRRVESLFTLANSVEAHYTAAHAKVEKLPCTIFDKAFRGELVPLEADLARAEGREYETAEMLLARIREKFESKPPKLRAKRKTKSTAAKRKSSQNT